MEALEGLESLEQVATLVLLGAALRDLSPLSALRDVGSLQITDLEYAELISVTDNPSLVQVSLPALTAADSVYIHHNSSSTA